MSPPRSAPGEASAERLASAAAAWAAAHGPGLVVGVSGPQGSGKSTVCARVAERLTAEGLRTAVLALDDLYLPRSERVRKAAELHPLWRTRGPPGTHDVALGLALLNALRRPGPTPLPRFDKAVDDRCAAAEVFEGPADVVLLEGWCVGVRAQGAAALAAPANDLERDEDPDGRWRAAVDAELAGAYAGLWARLDRLVVLVAPDWPTVCGWRAGAEAELCARGGGGMGSTALARFMAHYERLTRWAARDLPPRADLVLRLAPDRELQPSDLSM